MATYLGKLILVAGLGFEAYNLFAHQETVHRFNSGYEKGLARCLTTHEGIYNLLAGNQTIVRMIVIVHYTLSLLLLVSKSRFVKFLVMLGVILNTLVTSNPWLQKSENLHFVFLQNVAIIGGLLYLMGEESVVVKKITVVTQVEKEPATQGSESSAKTVEKQKKKKN